MTTPVLPRYECHPDASGRCHACGREGISFHGIRWITLGNDLLSFCAACTVPTSTRRGQHGVGVGQGPNHCEAPVDNQVIRHEIQPISYSTVVTERWWGGFEGANTTGLGQIR